MKRPERADLLRHKVDVWAPVACGRECQWAQGFFPGVMKHSEMMVRMVAQLRT